MTARGFLEVVIELRFGRRNKNIDIELGGLDRRQLDSEYTDDENLQGSGGLCSSPEPNRVTSRHEASDGRLSRPTRT